MIYSLSLAREQQVEKRKFLVAGTHTSELLEFFQSQSALSIRNYLTKNPLTLSAANPYTVCAHINLLDRGSNRVLNADPLANLVRTSLDRDDSVNRANRFYQVFVVDAATLDIRSNVCGIAFNRLYLSGEPAPSGTAPSYLLLDTDRLFVSVGVSWISAHNKEQRTVNSVLVVKNR